MVRSGSSGDVEGILRVRARRTGVRGVVGAECVLNDAAVDRVTGLHSIFRVDQKTLTAHRAAHIRRELGWLTKMHGDPLSLCLRFHFPIVSPRRDDLRISMFLELRPLE